MNSDPTNCFTVDFKCFWRLMLIVEQFSVVGQVIRKTANFTARTCFKHAPHRARLGAFFARRFAVPPYGCVESAPFSSPVRWKGNMAENYVKCRCQHCDGGIEFDANQLENSTPRIMDCPHCGLETILYIPASKASRPKTEVILSVLAERDISAEIRPMMRRQFESPRGPYSGDIICPNPNCGYIGRGLDRESPILGVILCLIFWPLAFIYVFAASRKRTCPQCGTPTRKVP